MKKVICSLGLLLAGLLGATANAQNPEFPGYLGVYVVEGYGGMQILDFIEDTPAEGLANAGEIAERHTIVRLAGRPTRTLRELQAARTNIPMDKEAKMVLRDNRGGMYHVWISRNPAIAMAAPEGQFGAAPRAGARVTGAPDTFRAGGRGVGDEGDFRPKNSGAGGEEEIRSKK